MIYDLLIIGAGPAGMSAAIYAKRANLNVVLFEKMAPGGQMINTAEIENYVGLKKASGFEVAMQMFEHVQSLDVETMFEEIIDIIDHGKTKEVITQSGSFTTKAVLIATGTVPRTLGVENEQNFANQGISWCAICDGPLYKDKKLAVIGGGNSAVEEASFLASIATHVTIIQNLDHLTADKKAQDILKKASNVEYRFNAQVLKFQGTDNLESIVIKNDQGKEETILVEGVFEYVGLTPITTFAKNLNITNKAGYILANEKMETACKGIYAAGDCTEKQIRQIVTAAADGAIAVQNVLKYLEAL
mgnify:CR=1 FL=1